MKFLNKKLSLAAAVVVVGITLAYATVTYVVRYTVTGTEVFRVNNDGSVLAQGGVTSFGPAKAGNTATGASVTMPTTTTGANYGLWRPVYNVGAAVTQGDVLIASNTGTGYVMKGIASSGATNVIGVAAEAIASAATGWMVPLGGQYAIAHTTGTVAIGDILVTTTSAAGYLATNNTPTAGTTVAKALSAGTAAGGNTLVLMY